MKGPLHDIFIIFPNINVGRHACGDENYSITQPKVQIKKGKGRGTRNIKGSQVKKHRT